MDYCFPGDEFGFKLAILVVVEKYTGMKASIVVLRIIQTWTLFSRPTRSPQSILLVDDLVKQRTGAKTIIEESPVKSKGKRGREFGAWIVENMCKHL